MTQLRDERLRQALDQAPDAQLQPHRRTREAIRAAAHAAVQPAWRRWWTRSGAHPTPWAAALATVALATVITVLWEGREVPGPRSDLPAPAAQPPAAEPPASAVAAPPAPAAEREPAQAAPPPAGGAQPSPADRARPAPLAVPRPSRAAPPVEAKAPAAEDRARTGVAPAAPSPAPAPAAAPAPAPAAAPESPAPGTAAAPPAAAAPSTRQLAPPAPQARALSGTLAWAQVRIEADGRSVVVLRPQAGELPALITSLLASTSDPAATGAPANLRLELAEGDEALGVLELVGERWRWTPLRDAGQPRWLRADPELAARVAAQARQLLKR